MEARVGREKVVQASPAHNLVIVGRIELGTVRQKMHRTANRRANVASRMLLVIDHPPLPTRPTYSSWGNLSPLWQDMPRDAEENRQCPVCHEPMRDQLFVVVPCDARVEHCVCLACLVQIETRMCPLCRRSLDAHVHRTLRRMRPRVRRALIRLVEDSLSDGTNSP